jgi:arylsulfatase A-like enzyme
MKNMKTCFNFLMLLSLVSLFGCKNQQMDKIQISEKKKPNIIYIMSDDLGYGDLGVYGQQKIKTPRLDAMAESGLVFTRHYAGSTVCMPSRASLLTGFHTGHSTVRGNPRWTSSGTAVDLKSEDITVAEELKRGDYTTAIIGKWGLAEKDTTSMPNNQGFDYFFGYRKHKTAHHYYPDTLYTNNKPFRTGNEMYAKKGKYSHDQFSEKAMEYIEKNKDTTFFLYLAYTIPHFELTVPEDSKKPYHNLNWEERTLKSRPGGYQHDTDGNITYAGMVSRMDSDIGNILDLLKDLKIDDNTLVIFTSDNGHEYDNGFFNSNGDFSGRKRDLYEGGIRIPLIAWWPGTIKAGTESDHISAFWDFLPTACDIAGIEPTTSKIDGISYLPTLIGKQNEQEQHTHLYWEFNEKQGPIQAVRKGNWKGVKFYNKAIEVYDLENDKGEKNNIARQNPEIADELEELITSSRTADENFKLEMHQNIK